MSQGTPRGSQKARRARGLHRVADWSHLASTCRWPSQETHIRRGHPAFFGALLVFGIIEGSISSYLSELPRVSPSMTKWDEEAWRFSRGGKSW